MTQIKSRWNPQTVLLTLEVSSLRGANLCGADLCDADLCGANLCGANLCGADLCGADLPYVTPIPNLDRLILDRIETGGRLEMRAWHTCETTHCRAGWAITLSPEGKTLESVFGSSVAGALIYNAAYPSMKTPDFMASNAAALADIKARAALAQANG